LPRKRPEASGMLFLAAAPTVRLLWHRGEGPTSSGHLPARTRGPRGEYRPGNSVDTNDMVLPRRDPRCSEDPVVYW